MSVTNKGRDTRTLGELAAALMDRLEQEYGDPEIAALATSTILTEMLHDQACLQKNLNDRAA